MKDSLLFKNFFISLNEMVKKPSDSSILEELHQDEEELRRDEKRAKIAFIFSSVLILISLSGVLYLIFQSIKSEKFNTAIINAFPSPLSEAPITPIISSQATPTPTPILAKETATKSETKDHYINIGLGSNQSLEWTDVPGSLTTANISDYNNIKEVHFEAFINVPNANGSVSVRLFNKTDSYAVWNSEITRNGTKDTYQFISPALIYDRGPRLYQVQMKSQLNVLANLTLARIHIVTE